MGAPVTWTGTGDGTSWSDPANWSSSALPGPGSDVTIDLVASDPTIQFTAVAGVAQINSLTSSELINISGGTLQVATTGQSSKNITLSGGTIKGGIWTLTGGASLLLPALSSGTLDGVTLGCDLTVADRGILNVLNGLTLSNAKLILASEVNET